MKTKIRKEFKNVYGFRKHDNRRGAINLEP